MIDNVPVLLVHGLGSSFEHGWRATGWADLLTDAGRAVIEFDLPGHGDGADPSVSPAEALLAACDGHERLDAVGFSAGGHALLHAAAGEPGRFRRLAVLGVGDAVVGTTPYAPPGPGRIEEFAAAIEAEEEAAEPVIRLIRRLIRNAGNSPSSVAAFMRARHGASPPDLARIEAPTLIVLGDKDFAGPGAALRAALPHGEAVILRGVDHFATPGDLGGIEAVLAFLDR
jgi:pimeloyl-ACP methyl ester carboxylesterase